jgi:hypothetical protein
MKVEVVMELETLKLIWLKVSQDGGGVVMVMDRQFRVYPCRCCGHAATWQQSLWAIFFFFSQPFFYRRGMAATFFVSPCGDFFAKNKKAATSQPASKQGRMALKIK